jgi:hypothetical protein
MTTIKEHGRNRQLQRPEKIKPAKTGYHILLMLAVPAAMALLILYLAPPHGSGVSNVQTSTSTTQHSPQQSAPAEYKPIVPQTYNYTKAKPVSSEEMIYYKGIAACLNLTMLQDRMKCLQDLNLTPVVECENDTKGRVACYNDYSMHGRCESVCLLLDPVNKRDCFTGCAVNLMKSHLCDQAFSDINKLRCLGFVAAEEQNKTICDTIPSEGSFTGTSVLNTDYMTYRDLCYASFAITKNATLKDTSDCELVRNLEMQLYCKAMVLNHTGLCSEITDLFRQAKCFRDFEFIQKARSSRSYFFPDRIARPYYIIYQNQPINSSNARIW